MGRPKTAMLLDGQQGEQLESYANSRSLPAGLVSRAKIILLSASGKTNVEIVRQLKMINATVSKWRRRRFLVQGISGLHDELRLGRPRLISDERVAQLVSRVKTKPEAGTHWSIRQNAAETRLSKSTVHRIRGAGTTNND